jgi:beta-lactam-binding protein with PASTA domain
MRKLIKFSLYFFAFILLGLMFGYFTFETLSFSRTVQMPNLYGKTLLESNKLLTSKDLYLKIDGEDYDSTVPPGVVIRQDVPAGKKVKERRAIKVVISKGPRVRSVPAFVGKTQSDAESLLLQKGLKVKEIMVHSDTVEKDKIVAQKPGPDEQAGDTVTLLVSLGPYNKFYYCPDFRGMSAEQANDLISRLDMKASIEGAGEKVGTQRPDPGRQIKTGDTIYLKLS